MTLRQFADERNGWACGDDTGLIATSDGGHFWEKRSLGIRARLLEIHFANATTAWIAGSVSNFREEPAPVALETQDGGRTWHVLDGAGRSRARLFQFPTTEAGWAFGRWETPHDYGRPDWYSATRTREGPYVAGTFRVSESLGKAILSWHVEAREESEVECTAIDVRQGADGDWRRISLADRLRRSAKDPRVFEFTWNPRKEKDVLPGTELFYRITVQETGGWVFPQEIPQGFVCRPWWDRQTVPTKTAFVAAAIALGYLAICSFLWACWPMSLLWLHRKLPLRELALSLAPGSTVRILVAALLNTTAIPAFAMSRRVRRQWIERYVAERVTFADLEPNVRERYLQHSDCLDAWVERRTDTALEALERIDSVAQRRVYIPLPVRVNDRYRGGLVDPSPAALRRFFETTPAVVAVVGTGGAGKSTMVFALARWALAKSIDDRLLPHRMIPVVLEEETSDLVGSVSGSLRQMLGPEDLEDDIVRSLLALKRVMVLVDALSERSLETQRHVVSIHAEATVNSLVVTTRRGLPSRRQGSIEISVARLWPFLGRWSACDEPDVEARS